MAPLRAEYDAIDLPTLERWVKDKRIEDLHLEFKVVRGGFERDHRRNLATAASGFANSDGGIVVWGIDARTNEDGVDAAHELVPIRRVKVVHGQLHEHTRQAANPTVDGIEHRVISAGDDDGYLVTLVPMSMSGPHMAGLGESRYFKRSGSTFYRMEHFDVADMFGKRQRPELVVELDYTKDSSSTGEIHNYELVATVKNTGRVMARFFRIIFSFPSIAKGWPQVSPSTTFLSRIEHTNTETPLFPGETRSLAFNRYRYHMNHDLHYEFRRSGWPNLEIQILEAHSPSIVLTRSLQELQNF
jgi:hypothetical protein